MKHIKTITTVEERQIQSPDIVTMEWYNKTHLEPGEYLIDGVKYEITECSTYAEPILSGFGYEGISIKTTAKFHKK